MAVRCKFRLSSVTRRRQTVWDGTKNVDQEVNSFDFYVVTNGSDEDKAFWASTPVGKLELGIVNPEAVKELELNRTYYVTLTPSD